MSFQKYNIKANTVYWDVVLKKEVLQKTKNSITFRSILEYNIYKELLDIPHCQVLCQIPIKGYSFLWNVDFLIRPTNNQGKEVLQLFRELVKLPPGKGSLYLEAKGVVTKEFAEKLKLCRYECPTVYYNLCAFGDTPFGLVMEKDLEISFFPIYSTCLLKKIVLFCKNSFTE